MKKQALTFILISSFLFSKEYNISDVINLYNQDNYEKEYIIIEEMKLDNQLQNINTLEANGLEAIWKNSYSTLANKNQGDSNLRLNYNDFNIQTSYNSLSEDSTFSVGLEKDIKNLIYSEKKYKLQTYEEDKKITLINLEDKTDNKIISLIGLYKNYQDINVELSILERDKERLNNEYSKIKIAYELGADTELNLEYAKLRYDNNLEEIELLKKDLELLTNQFEKSFKLDLNNATLLPFEKPDLNYQLNIDYIGSHDLSILESEKRNALFNNEYEKHLDKLPNMKLGADYYVDSNDWQLNFTISKTFASYNSSKIQSEIDLKEFEIKERELKESIKLQKLEIQTKYNSLVRNIQNLKREMEVKKMEYLIEQKRYEIGKIDYISYIEASDNFKLAESNYLKKENELSAFLLELNYKK